MKKIVTLVCLTLTAHFCEGAIVFSDNFNSDNNGNLVGDTTPGYGTWTQTSGSSSQPIQVVNNAVALGATGQDAANTVAIAATMGTSIYMGATISVSAANSAGDFFLYLSPSVGSSTMDDRLYAKSSGAGFVFGIAPNSSTTEVYGSTVLSLNTVYQIVVEYNFVSGLHNDTMNVYINPTSGVEGNNSTYVTSTSSATGSDLSASPNGGINFRQGTSTDAPTETIDNLIVATSFNDIVPVPEPGTWGAISGAGLLGLCGVRAWRQRRQQNAAV
jgi:hypothetical protein